MRKIQFLLWVLASRNRGSISLNQKHKHKHKHVWLFINLYFNSIKYAKFQIAPTLLFSQSL